MNVTFLYHFLVKTFDQTAASFIIYWISVKYEECFASNFRIVLMLKFQDRSVVRFILKGTSPQHDSSLSTPLSWAKPPSTSISWPGHSILSYVKFVTTIFWVKRNLWCPIFSICTFKFRIIFRGAYSIWCGNLRNSIRHLVLKCRSGKCASEHLLV